jgi:hypothetical protein
MSYEVDYDAAAISEAAERYMAAARQHRQNLAQEKREAEAKQAKSAEIVARAQAAQEYDQGEAWAERIDQRIAAGIAAGLGSQRDSSAVELDARRALEDKLRGALHEIAAGREREARLAERVAQLEERIKLPAPMPPFKQWTPNTAALAGDLYAHNGAAWSAQCRTASEPKDGEHWQCVSAPGKDGENGRGFRPRGIWSSAKTYRELDVVSHNGGAWAARRDDPGVCPGEGWQCFSMPGKRGPAGETGARGEKGDGVGLLRISAWAIAEGYLAIPELSNGQIGAALDLRPVLERFLMETDRS